MRQRFSTALLLVQHDAEWWANFTPDPEESGTAAKQGDLPLAQLLGSLGARVNVAGLEKLNDG